MATSKKLNVPILKNCVCKMQKKKNKVKIQIYIREKKLTELIHFYILVYVFNKLKRGEETHSAQHKKEYITSK